MRLHKEGIGILIGFFLFFLAVSFVLHTHIPVGLEYVVIAIIWIPYLFMIWFFRNPVREGTSEIGDIIAPVDGKVVIIQEVEENEFIKEKCIQLSIFMSPLNVHVTRYPVSGKVIYKKYHPGRYLVAFNPKSSELNERTSVAVETDFKKQIILFRQIAGALARRIVLYTNEGDHADAGKEFGFIKFGSRLDIYLPLGTEILVEKGDKTIGGIQKIAQLK